MTHKDDQLYAVEKAIDYMNKHLDRNITSEELARQVGYSPYHFSRIFKEITGIPPRHYLSALRIEKGKKVLLSSSESILKTLLSTGFQSFGTFSSKFKQFVGMTPSSFQRTTKDLHQFVALYQRQNSIVKDNKPSSLVCNLIVPENFKGIMFIGLFPRPIPDQKPVVGTANLHTQVECTFTDIPPGTYYLLAAAIPFSLNPADYFLLDKALRGKFDEPLVVTETTNINLQLTLREPLPTDPPILVNLPQLLFEKEKNKAN